MGAVLRCFESVLSLEVWAYKPSKEKTPPESGWKVPYDGPVDESFKVKEKKESDKTVRSLSMYDTPN